jgi:hypothetical protein
LVGALGALRLYVALVNRVSAVVLFYAAYGFPDRLWLLRLQSAPSKS